MSSLWHRAVKYNNKKRRNYDSFDDRGDFFNPNIPLAYHAQGQDIVRGMLRLPLCVSSSTSMLLLTPVKQVGEFEEWVRLKITA